MLLRDVVVFCVCLVVVAQGNTEEHINEKTETAHVSDSSTKNVTVSASGIPSPYYTTDLTVTNDIKNINRSIDSTLFEDTELAINIKTSTDKDDIINMIANKTDFLDTEDFPVLMNINNSFNPNNFDSMTVSLAVPIDIHRATVPIDINSTTDKTSVISPPDSDMADVELTTTPTGNNDDENLYTTTNNMNDITTDIYTTTETTDPDYITYPEIESLFTWSDSDITTDISSTTENPDISTITEAFINYSTHSELKSMLIGIDSETTTDINTMIEDLDINTTTETVDTSSIDDTIDVSSTTESTNSVQLAEGEKKLSEYILAVLEHFKQPDPTGLPGLDMPDPCPIEDTRESISPFETMYMMDTVVHGTSKLRILYINVDVKNLRAEAAMSVDALQARGTYTISSWFNPAHGPFTIDVTGMKVLATATLGVEQDGRLQAQEIYMNITIKTMVNKFENLGFVAGLFQDYINSGGTSFFDSKIPYMLRDAYPKIRAEINSKLDKFTDDIRFANSISPLDMVAIEVRNYMRYKKLDPFQINGFNTTIGIFTLTLSDTWLTGISSFQRVGNVTLTMENNTVVADFEVGTQKLEGRTKFGLSTVGALISKFASASFSVEYLRIRVIVAQPLDTTKHPVLKDIDFEIGNIQARSDGLGTLDYVIEVAVNILPNLLRYQIVKALDELFKITIQKKLYEINVDDIVNQSLPLMDELQDFKLSYLEVPVNYYEKDDEDNFFNF